MRDEVGLTLVRTVGLRPPGTFVRLDNGGRLSCCRRGERANFPLVASVVDAKGAAIRNPGCTTRSAASSAFRRRWRAGGHRETALRTMVRLGCTRRSAAPASRADQAFFSGLLCPRATPCPG